MSVVTFGLGLTVSGGPTSISVIIDGEEVVQQLDAEIQDIQLDAEIIDLTLEAEILPGLEEEV